MTDKKQNHTIVFFVIITFLLSWPFMIYGYGFTEDLLTRDVFAMIGMIMVAVSAVVTRSLFENKDLQDFHYNKGKLKWYLTGFSVFIFYYLLPYLFEFLLGNLNIKTLTGGRKVVFIFSLTIAYFAAFGEEFGWRGFLQTRLINKNKKISESLIIVGMLWGIWHFPIALGPLLKEIFANTYSIELLQDTLVSCAQILGASIGLSVIFGYVYLKYKSIYLNSFIHFLYIGIRDATLILFGFTIFSLPIALILFIIFITISVKFIKYEENLSDSKPDS